MKRRKREKNKHHVFFPKKLYRNNRIVIINAEVHRLFHVYFDHHCRSGEDRPCRSEFCRYENICCYAGTDTPFGRKVMFRVQPTEDV